MVAKVDITLEQAIANEKREFALLTLKYAQVMQRLVQSARTDPKFSPASWGPLAELVDTENFERIGTWKEIVRWPAYTQLLTEWAVRSEWVPRVRRITESDRVVYLELAEFGKYAEMSDSIYSITVYEFDSRKKLRHLDVYMQREQIPLPAGTWELNKKS